MTAHQKDPQLNSFKEKRDRKVQRHSPMIKPESTFRLKRDWNNFYLQKLKARQTFARVWDFESLLPSTLSGVASAPLQ